MAASFQQRLGALVIGLGPVESGLLTPQGGHLGPQLGDLGIDLFGGVLEFPALGAELGLQAAGLGLGRRQVRLPPPGRRSRFSATSTW